MISLLSHESEAKPRMSVNNMDIIRMYLGYNWLITQKTPPINTVTSTYCPRFDIYLSVLWLVISDISQYKTL